MKQSMSCSTPASSIRIATSMCLSNMPRHRPTTSSSRSQPATAERSRHPPPPADAMVPQHLVLGRKRLETDAHIGQHSNSSVIHAHHTDPLFLESLDDYYLYCEGPVPLLFTDNETNQARLFGKANGGPYVKDGINNYVVQGQQDAVNTEKIGTKASPHYQLTLGPGSHAGDPASADATEPGKLGDAFGQFDAVMNQRLKEADEFYDAITPPAIKAITTAPALCDRPSQGCSGPNSITISTPISG